MLAHTYSHLTTHWYTHPHRHMRACTCLRRRFSKDSPWTLSFADMHVLARPPSQHAIPAAPASRHGPRSVCLRPSPHHAGPALLLGARNRAHMHVQAPTSVVNASSGTSSSRTASRDSIMSSANSASPSFCSKSLLSEPLPPPSSMSCAAQGGGRAQERVGAGACKRRSERALLRCQRASCRLNAFA